jgi:hypothetical protein
MGEAPHGSTTERRPVAWELAIVDGGYAKRLPRRWVGHREAGKVARRHPGTPRIARRILRKLRHRFYSARQVVWRKQNDIAMVMRIGLCQANRGIHWHPTRSNVTRMRAAGGSVKLMPLTYIGRT